MKKLLKHRILPFLCVFTVLVSALVVPAYATFPDEFRDYTAVDDWNAQVFASNSLAVDYMAAKLNVGVSANAVFWGLVNGQITNKAGHVSRSELDIIASSFNVIFTGTIGETFPEQVASGTSSFLKDVLAVNLIGHWEPRFVVERHPGSGLYRIKETNTGLFVVDSSGKYPYCETADNLGSDQWIPISYLNSGQKHMVSYEALSNTADALNKKLTRYGEYYIVKQGNSGAAELVLGNSDGLPYVARAEKDKWAVDSDRNDSNVTIDGENVEVVEGNQTNLDLSGLTMILPDGTFQFIDKVIYDESTKSYHIDSHDTINYTVNNYYTWNYYINYTSITYIGQTEEYNKYYEVYYELPDGRDSADLTKEDLEQLNLSIDVIPYGRSADDTSLRSLYHFDGDTKDSSYWNYCTDFTWNKGASLTYMDAGVFDGALYLDETEHDFTLTLPSNIGSGDFTLQFRYYQSATAAPQTDSFLYLGNEGLIAFDGAQFTMWSPKVATPVGSWNELAVMRKSGTMYFYLNGVLVHSVASSHFFPNTVHFQFGNKQQTFKYLDEFRFVNKAVYEISGYEPTSVPHDTNLTLVVPTECVPVADEYWDIKNDQTPVLSYDLTDASPSYFDGGNGLNSIQFNKLIYYSGYSSIASGSGYVSLNTLTSGTGNSYGFRQDIIVADQSYSTVRSVTGKSGQYSNLPDVNGKFVLSLVDSSGAVHSFPFTATFPFMGDNTSYKTMTFSWGTMEYRYWFANGYYRGSVFIYPTKGSPLDIVYAEIVQGTSTNLTAEWVESVTLLDKSDLNTPTLAVRTDIDITSYQIGGVRPSIPEKGQVWAMVENDRIVSIQIYNGQAWEGVDGRIWTGQRWIPASSYNIITLQDMYDIVDATPNYEYIYSEAGFWAWWQKSWNAFTEKLFATLGSGATGSGGSTLNPDQLPSVPDDDSTSEDDGWTIIDLLVVLKDGTWNVITGVVSTAYDGFSGFVSTVSDAGNFFTPFKDEGEGSIFYIPLEEGASVWD